MRRRLWLGLFSAVLLVGVAATPARAAIGPVTVVQVGCDFDEVTADAVVTTGADPRVRLLPRRDLRGRGRHLVFPGQRRHLDTGPGHAARPVLAAADDGSSTFLLYQSSTGVWIAKRPHERAGQRPAGVHRDPGRWGLDLRRPRRLPRPVVGGLDRAGRPAQRVHPQKLFQSKTIGAGDCIDPIVKQQITINPTVDDEHPSIVLKPASAGASEADLFWSRNDGAQGLSGHIWTGSADCTADWDFRQLSFAGEVDLNPDAFRSGAGNNHVVFSRDGPHVVYLSNASGTYRGRQFVTPGVQPRVTTSQGVVFVAYRDFRQHPFLAVYRNGAGRAAT